MSKRKSELALKYRNEITEGFKKPEGKRPWNYFKIDEYEIEDDLKTPFEKSSLKNERLSDSDEETLKKLPKLFEFCTYCDVSLNSFDGSSVLSCGKHAAHQNCFDKVLNCPKCIVVNNDKKIEDGGFIEDEYSDNEDGIHNNHLKESWKDWINSSSSESEDECRKYYEEYFDILHDNKCKDCVNALREDGYDEDKIRELNSSSENESSEGEEDSKKLDESYLNTITSGG
jgi:hypothetical protein